MIKHKGIISAACMGVALLTGCYSNNCPLENNVTCNYGFYDAEGTPSVYNDTITVTTLLPGHKTVYTYRKLGSQTVIKDYQDKALVNLGYTETISQQRRDTILLNKIHSAAEMKLPMSFFNTCDTLILSYRRISLKDTIKIEHTSYPYVELPECGTYRYHTLKAVTATDAAIDRIEIGNPQVNYEGEENIKIYFNGVVE